MFKPNIKSCNAKREGNAGERWKTTIGLISKKSNFARAAHLFVHSLLCFAPLQRETSRNVLVTRFVEEMSFVFKFTSFFHCPYFHLALVTISISHFVTAATKFSCSSSNKKMSPLFVISRSRPPTFFFSLSFSSFKFQICGNKRKKSCALRFNGKKKDNKRNAGHPPPPRRGCLSS